MFYPILTAMTIASASPPIGVCVAAPRGQTAAAALARAVTSMHVPDADGGVLHVRAQMIRELRDLSDRGYPPFDASISDEDIWFDPDAAVERTRAPGPAGAQLWDGPFVTMMGVDSLRPASDALHGFARWERAFDAWAVIADWARGGDAVVEGLCRYRDYDRLTLRRPSQDGGEHLLLSENDGLPIAMVRTERSYFYGPEPVEYVYLNWDRIGGALYPFSTVRVVDGNKDRLRSVRSGADGSAVVPRRLAPPFVVVPTSPAQPRVVVVPPEPFWTDNAPDTLRVGPHAFLLVNASFTSAVALAADTVFLLDATQGERRAQQDSAWIGRLFPGRHPVAFVAATSIWPHIAGLRYWVANGATVITHPASRAAVMKALDRRWLATPDLLERRRPFVHIRVDTVRTEEARAGGAIRIFAVDGIASEGILAAYVVNDRFLWASDRVQDIVNPSLYVTELAQAAELRHITPLWTSGPHVGVVAWHTIEELRSKP